LYKTFVLDRAANFGIPVVPPVQSRYLVKEKVKIISLEDCCSGGTELIREIQEKFEGLIKLRILEAYGLTEASPGVTSNPSIGIHKIGSVGIPLPSTEVKIVNPETFEELPMDGIGEIVVKGPQVMKGYFRNEKESENIFRDGWLLTGDLGRMDKDGYLFITGRTKEMIINSGFKVYPQQVENVLCGHSSVMEAGVCGIPDGFRGEAVKAVVVLNKGVKISESELIDYCKEHLAPYKIPKVIEFANDLPKSMLGKVLRRLLHESNESTEK